MDAELDELLEKLRELDRENPGPCIACFMGCEPRKGSQPYPCPEPLRRWALKHMWSAGLYEEER